MNRIYKVIWSKVKHQYVVVSELAHRDGKRSSAASKTMRSRIAAFAVCGIITSFIGYGLLPVEPVFAANEVQQADKTQYVAFKAGDGDEVGDTQNLGTRWNPINYECVNVQVNKDTTVKYWVREGYELEVQPNAPYIPDRLMLDGEHVDWRINAVLTDPNAVTGSVLQTTQSFATGTNTQTTRGDSLEKVEVGYYVGVSNSEGVATEGKWNYIVDPNMQGNFDDFIDTNPTQSTNVRNSGYWKNVRLQGDAYYLGDQKVDSKYVYVIDGQTGVFVTEKNGNEVYTGKVYGAHNEILMTGKDEKGKYYSYWTAKSNDDNVLLADSGLTLSDYRGNISTIERNQRKLAAADIKSVKVDNQKNSINLITNTKFDENWNPIPGTEDTIPGFTITSTGGTGEKDVQIQFKDANNNKILVNAGSKVEANKQDVSSDTTLDTLTINGKTFGLSTGTKYSDGDGIAISTDGKHTISVSTVDAKDGGNLYFTDDGKLNSKDYRLINGTADLGNGKTGYKVNADGTVELTVQDGTDESSKQTVTIADVASKSVLDDMGKTLEGAVMYDKPGDTYNYNSVTLGNKSNKYNNDGTGKPTGGVTLTNVAYADVNGKDTGSNAVNVDLLKDYVGENAAVYSEGNGIDISTDGKHTISVSTVDAKDGGNLYFTDDGKLNSKDYRLINGTDAIGGTEEQPVYGYKVKENGTVELIVQDGTDENSKQTVTIADVASKSALDNMGKTLEGAVMYDKPGDTYNYNFVTLGNESNKYNNDGTGKPTGGVTLTNVAYADVNGKDTGSNAVNVDLLKDYVNENGGTTYTGGDGISVDDQKDEISVKVDENSNLNFTRDGKLRLDHITHHDGLLGSGLGDYTQVEGTKLYHDGSINSEVNSVLDNSTNTFDFSKDGGKFVTESVTDTRVPFLGGKVTTTTSTSEFNEDGATFTQSETAQDYRYSILGYVPTGIPESTSSTTKIQGKHITAGDVQINGESAATITGLDNTTIDYTGFGGGRAATEAQLKQIRDDLKVTASDGIAINDKNEVSVNAGEGLGFSEEANEKGTKELEVKVGSNLKINDQNQVDLKDNITLGTAEGPHIQLNGTPDGENNVVSIVDGNSNELFTIGQDGLVSSDGDVIADADGGKYSLSEVSQFAVRYDKNGNGTVNHNSVTLASTDEYMTVKDSAGHVISAAGGTTLKNVAYASGQDGSEAVNVDYLTTQLDKSQSAAANADFYLRNGTESLGTAADGSAITVGSQTTGYKADDNGNIDMIVANENGMEKHVILTDVASKAALDEVTTDVNTGWTATDGTNSIAVNPDNATLAFKGDENVTVSADAANHAINVSLNDDITLGDKNGSHITLNGTTGTFGLVTEGEDSVSHVVNFGTDGATFSKIVSTTSDEGYTTEETFKTVIDGGTVTVSKGDEGTTVIDGATITTGKVTGLANTEWSDKIANEVAADKLGAGTGAASIAATQGQLKDVADMAGSAADEAAKHTTIKRGDNNLDIIAGENDNGGIEYTISLKDTIQLGDIHTGVLINGESGIVRATNAVTIGDTTTLTNGKLIGLANVDWNPVQARTDEELYNPEQAATQGQLDDLYDSVVGYDVIGGKVDYSSITLGHGSEYKGSAGGGTHIYNVAYASGDYGSEAVNVDYLKDQISNATTNVTANEKHIATNVGPKAEMPHADYSVGEDGKVTLTEVDGNGKPTGNSVVISDVASATDVGNVDKLVDAGLGVDENGNSNVVDAILDVDNKVGDLNYNDVKGDSIQNGDDTTTAIGKLDNRIDGLETGVSGALDEAKKHNTVEAGSNLTMSKNENANGGTEYKLSVDPNLKVDTVTATGNISAGSFTTDNITIDGIGADGKHTGTITGLSNTTWNKAVADAIAANANGEAGTAATQGQLQQAMNTTVQYDTNEDGSVNKGSVSLGYTDADGKQQNTQIHNVAAGEALTDAVNVGQLAAFGSITQQNISMLSNSVNKLDNRIDRVGAGAAALAALHPLDFDPDAKWDFAAGYGNYRGANAVAVGAYYRPNEDVMFSVGGSMGGGENMVNAGVSLKIGAGSSNVTTSRVAMAKEIKSMRDIVAKQDAQIQKLTAMVNALVGVQSEPDTTTMFPDVPENHWAYEAVEAMAKSGLVKGYPDGEFKGDRTMTRYEFAQIVYNAIQAGAEVDARLVEEFKPELEYFHIATVAKDKDGNPTIERVRAN